MAKARFRERPFLISRSLFPLPRTQIDPHEQQRDVEAAGCAGPPYRPARDQPCAAGRAVLQRLPAAFSRRSSGGARTTHGHRPSKPRRLQGHHPRRASGSRHECGSPGREAEPRTAGRHLRGGIPETVPLSTVNRQCSSGLQAVANIAGGIRNGSYGIGMACGVESMSLAEIGKPGNITSRLLENEKARDCLIPMGITSEKVAERFGISREKQDTFALASQQKAARARSRGCFRDEIVSVTTTILDDTKGTKKRITVSQDEGIRPDTTMEGLSKLKPAFKNGGSTTAGNASQVSDGAAAIPLAQRSKAEELGLPILGVLRSYAVVGVPPDIRGIGPAYAIPVALQKSGLTVNDVDIFEINEAFASQAVYCVEKLGIPPEKLNPLGGAVALGHPLGCTGARQVITLLNELKRRRKRAYGVVSMCIGTGMGAAAVFEYPGN
ncbi:3-ketoacyl-CoA thiolase B, peroxisomal isoform X1 [Heterocephalus glaber]|uniref:3-ketoacyl-CoA thiolase B, peroxisomal isoform X1 n=1 Tax=Heterocephalus glaber TaxID=10181 RepID=A0AAX6PL94_HETGA|nr:3-ketoacyl-CoA thiolase B, peroxisomal isoform X1 [Heterocephalus glaber]